MNLNSTLGLNIKSQKELTHGIHLKIDKLQQGQVLLLLDAAMN